MTLTLFSSLRPCCMYIEVGQSLYQLCFPPLPPPPLFLFLSAALLHVYRSRTKFASVLFHTRPPPPPPRSPLSFFVSCPPVSQVEKSAGIMLVPKLKTKKFTKLQFESLYVPMSRLKHDDIVQGCYRRSDDFDAGDSPRLENMSAASHAIQFVSVPAFFGITQSHSRSSLYFHSMIRSDDDRFERENLRLLVNIIFSSSHAILNPLYYMMKYLIKRQPLLLYDDLQYFGPNAV